jgi:hypothetical protein
MLRSDPASASVGPLPIWIEPGALWCELHDAECVVRRIVDIECEANPIDIKPQRAIDVTHRQCDDLD